MNEIIQIQTISNIGFNPATKDILCSNTGLMAFIAILIISIIISLYFVTRSRAYKTELFKLNEEKEEIERKGQLFEKEFEKYYNSTKPLISWLEISNHLLQNKISPLAQDIFETHEKQLVDEKKDALEWKARQIELFVQYIKWLQKLDKKDFELDYYPVKPPAVKAINFFSSRNEIKYRKVENNISGEFQAYCNRQVVEQVLISLMNYCIAQSSDNSRIVFNCQYAKSNDDFIRLSLSYTGNHISDIDEEIFKEKAVILDNKNLIRLNLEELGLGLFIKSVQHQKGKWGVNARNNKGFTIWFTLPNKKID